jgi:Carboxypeptidase regulatory-like domain
MIRLPGKFAVFAVCLFPLLLLVANVFAQETTAGIQGTVRDASGAVVGGAHVVVRGTTLAGDKSLDSESTGYYRFANLPPGVYTVEVSAKGFKSVKRGGLTLEIGHLPTVDITMEVGATVEVVEVSGQAPAIDVTTNTNQTNVTQDVIDNTPHGYSFQSVIQYAPMARNEPLAGGSSMMGSGGTGGSLPGSSGNGMSVGFSVGGAADSESAYLVEGQDTENISGGASQANVPFEFIQEVQVKTSGIEAEHGGALGGVVNVVMKKGSNAYHGSVFGTFESDAMDGGANATLRYDPTPVSIPTGFDNDSQTYSPKKDHFRIAQPGFTVGGPMIKDRLWFFLAFAPEYNARTRNVNFGPSLCASIGGCPSSALGNQYFTQDNQEYFSTARLDFTLTSKVRLFGSWLYQYARETGDSLPTADPINSEAGYQLNTAIFSPLSLYSHGLGFAAPNATYNVGADITLTPKIVSTTRFGYFFSNYHDFGWPISSSDLNWSSSGVGALDNSGAALPTALAQPSGTSTTPFNPSYTLYNASKHYQLNEDVAFFKSGWAGTHNFKVGYQLNHLSNVISQNGNVPFVALNVGAGQNHGAGTAPGGANCALLAAEWGTCTGQYGIATITDFATILPKPAVDWNHAFFAQDAWTVGHGLTLNLGIRIEKESLPVPPGLISGGQTPPASINFSWSDKIEPRLGAAWGSRNGTLKIFGSYGVVNDVMKLLLAQTSWGAQVFEQCSYALGPDASGGFNNSDITATFVNGRACPNGGPTQGANFAGGAVPPSFVDQGTGVSLIENVNLRPWEPVAPGVKPYRQHEIVAGVDYQIAKDWAFEARYDRRRLDHVIEDASLADPSNFEMYTIVNPGQGVNKTIDGYANYLQSIGSAFGIPHFAFNANPSAPFGTCPTCPNNPQAIRNYDGVEIRLTKTASKGFAGMFSYTYSQLWGNYTGLTTTDQIDGGTTGRNSPDTTRAFDEPFYYFGANGKSTNGPLPTDRPNTFKGNAYYSIPWKGMTTTFGLFQVAYQGSPMSSFTDVGLSNGSTPFEATYIFGRGQWVNVSGAQGAVAFSNPYSRRTPWFTQTDFNIGHSIKVNKDNEHQVLSFQGTLTNLLNQHSVVSYWQGFNSNYFTSQFFPSAQNVFGGAAFYQAAETGYDPAAAANSSGLIKNNNYGQPNLWQLSRNIRLGVKFTF